MFQCLNCDAIFHGRSQFLVYISNNRNCTGVKSTYISDEESEVTIDDSDKGPNWSPSLLKDSAIPLSAMSTPIIEEQMKEAVVLQISFSMMMMMMMMLQID
ncbi:uncharacterized protein LOC120355047 isoform X2 [Nilaparvata lugens]|uniref:uncharacterized protein LOC120355047 isoform X2 n=1 Tax=Nilaparvata lugens TaxID=108931 RepID=UPI00193E0885|nr:uncharacterized protein LOC120355047 isoform X2 [Nilaparvata lugens]